MKIGIMMFITETTAQPAEVARALEERGFESMFLPEHTHIPTSRTTPYPAGEPLPPEYYRTIDPFIGLMAAAAATSRLRIGTGLCLPAQHDPIILAKSVATLDALSGGRLVLGVGFGWNRDEIESHGVTFGDRRELTREHMHLMKALWTEEIAAYEGNLVSLAPSYAWPKPIQRPHPPVLVGGGAGPKLFDHVVDYADGWAPIGPAAIEQGLPVLQQAFENAGRDPASIQLSPFDPRPTRRTRDRYRELGAERLVVNIPPLERDDMLRCFDDIAGELELDR